MKKILMMLGMAAALLATGCVSTPVPQMDRRVTLAPNLGSSLYVTDVRCTKGNSAFYTFQANVVNNCSGELWVEYKVVWVNAEGMAINPNAVWEKTAIMAHEIKALQYTAPSAEAVDMLFYVRRLEQ